MNHDLYHDRELALLHCQKMLYQIMEHLGITEEDTRLP